MQASAGDFIDSVVEECVADIRITNVFAWSDVAWPRLPTSPLVCKL